MRAHGDIGETLIEILLTVVIVGLTFTALFSVLANTVNAGNAQRLSVQTDVVMRNYAEATKAATQACVAGAAYTVSYVPPTGFSVATSPTATVCPPLATPLLLTLTVRGPVVAATTMQIKVSTP